ncbi:hypothetical protein Y032_0893g2901, partial [Ancylostoma ceylanicum]
MTSASQKEPAFVSQFLRTRQAKRYTSFETHCIICTTQLL